MIEGVQATNSGIQGNDTSSADIKIWAQKYWGLPQETKLMVRELRTEENGVPQVSTAIAVLSLAVVDKTIKIPKRIREIHEQDIREVNIWS